MAKRVLCIEIGNSLTKVMEADYMVKNPKIYHCVSFKTPQGMVSDGAVNLSQNFIEALKRCLSEHKIKTKQVVFTITSSKIASREVVIPKVKEGRISALVETNASDYFPVQLSDYELGYSVLNAKEEDSTQLKLLVYAAPKKMLQGYREIAEACGLLVVGYDHGGNSLYQVVKEECAEGTQMVVKVDETATLISILQDGRLVLQRNITYGVDAIIAECMEENGMNYKEALSMLRKNDCVQEGEAGQDAEETLGYLVNGVLRVVDYYKSKAQDAKVERICLTGLGADIAGLDERLSEGLGNQVEVLTEAKGFSIDKRFKNASLGEYIGCLGAAVAPIGFIKVEKTVEKGGDANLTVIATIFFVGCVFVALALLVTALLPYFSAKKEKEQKELYLSSLQYIEGVYNEYVTTKAEYDYLIGLDESTLNRNEALVAFIEELEEKMPSNIRVVSMICDESTVVMSVEVASKNEAAATIAALSEFESLATVYTGSISETISDEGIKKVTFSVQCTYYPYGYEDQEAEEAE